MVTVPEELEGCNTDEKIAALLIQGETQREIANKNRRSKTWVQTIWTDLKAGDRYPPPEILPVIRRQGKSIARVAKRRGLESDHVYEFLDDCFSSLIEGEELEVGPGGDVTFEDFIAFAQLATGQLEGDCSAQELISDLAELYRAMGRHNLTAPELVEELVALRAEESGGVDSKGDGFYGESGSNEDQRTAQKGHGSWEESTASNQGPDGINGSTQFQENPAGGYIDRDPEYQYRPSNEPQNLPETTRQSLDREAYFGPPQCRKLEGRWNFRERRCEYDGLHPGSRS